MDALERLENEPPKAYAALQLYASLGPYRSIRKAFKQWKDAGGIGALSYWEKWSRKYRWVERCLEHDETLAEIERQAWAEKAKEVREHDYELGQKLRKVAAEILDEAQHFTRERRVIENGETVVYRALDLSVSVKAAEAASKMQRLATGSHTESIQLSSKEIDQLIAIEMRRFINGGEDPEEDETEEDLADDGDWDDDEEMIDESID